MVFSAKINLKKIYLSLNYTYLIYKNFSKMPLKYKTRAILDLTPAPIGNKRQSTFPQILFFSKYEHFFTKKV